MRLRPYAPLAVVGAGLLIMTMAPHAASADDAGAPVGVVVTASGSDLLVSWQVPAGTNGLTDFDLRVTDPATGDQVLDRTVDAASTQARLTATDLAGHTDVVVTVASEYGQDQRYPGDAVRVTLPSGPVKPALPPAVSVEGRVLQVRLPAADAAEGVTGRVVRLFRDGTMWKELSVPVDRTSVSRRIRPGHSYDASYQDVTATAGSPFSEESDDVATAAATTGPAAVRKVKVSAAGDGVRVHWSAATAKGSEVTSYRVRVTKDGKRIGSAYTAAVVRTIVVPHSAFGKGVYGITVTAQDETGGTSSSTTTVESKD